jgi:hypothetical protein
MALFAVYRTMPLGKGKEIMIEGSVGPLCPVKQMAERTIFRHSRLYMIRIRGGKIILSVTVDAINTRNIKTSQVLRLMTIAAVGCPVGTKQGETARLVNFINITDQP